MCLLGGCISRCPHELLRLHRDRVLRRLLQLGYPESGTAEGIAAAKAKAKSFVSCAVGRMAGGED